MREIILLLFTLLPYSMTCSEYGSHLTAGGGSELCRCVGVSDGDTITVLTQSKKQYKVRLANIDCPERGQPFGTRAKQFTSDFCIGKQVRIEHKGKKDRSGRVIGTVFNLSGVCLNKALVEAGLAWHYKKYSDDPSYGRLEAVARAGKRGLWADKYPIAPWDWRKKR